MNLMAIFNSLRGAKPRDPAPPGFWYEGDDLHTQRTVTFEQTAREGTIVIDMPDGKRAEMKLSHMLKTGHAIRAPLAGINGAKGYLYVHFDVE